MLAAQRFTTEETLQMYKLETMLHDRQHALRFGFFLLMLLKPIIQTQPNGTTVDSSMKAAAIQNCPQVSVLKILIPTRYVKSLNR